MMETQEEEEEEEVEGKKGNISALHLSRKKKKNHGMK
jgi:hypothetical protein